MTVFVVALSMVIVLELVHTARIDRRIYRGYAESTQSDYILKSGLSLGRVLLEMPSPTGAGADWLGDPWALVPLLSTLPVEGFGGDTRLLITDESSKLDLNAVGGALPTGTDGGNPASNPAIFWMGALSQLFANSGIGASSDSNDVPTVGGRSYEPAQQVAVIRDWIDPDADSFHDPTGTFLGDGIESGTDRSFFPGKPLYHISQLLLIPGFTGATAAAVAPYLRITTGRARSGTKVNINTASYPVLRALGFPEETIADILRDQRGIQPITREKVQNYIPPGSQIGAFVDVKSTGFSIIARSVTASSTRWIRATVGVSGGTGARQTEIKTVEMY